MRSPPFITEIAILSASRVTFMLTGTSCAPCTRAFPSRLESSCWILPGSACMGDVMMMSHKMVRDGLASLNSSTTASRWLPRASTVWIDRGFHLRAGRE